MDGRRIEPAAAPPEQHRPRGAGARGALDRALSALPPKQRAPIHLRYIEERSYEEIAEALDAPVGTVKTNIYRGLKRMRELIGGNLDDYL
ncbi:MAG: RNA polymerase sigma factor [Candidatus Eisenbacteria bacterium]